MTRHQLATLQAVGQLEGFVHGIADLESRLDRVPLWQPAAVLTKQAIQARALLADMQARLDRHLVVTLIGPSGAGKSTLLNALAGVDDLSPVSTQRPTTRKLVVLANDNEALHQILGPLAHEEAIVQAASRDGRLDHVILVDTPDTDSVASPAHHQLLHQVVARSDVLICVFDAQNPKRRDHIDFMAPLVQRFHGESVVVVVNKCDRHSQEELSQSIGPDFDAYLRAAWDTTPEAVLLISARRNLQQPHWESQAGPRHDLDQFAQLHELIFAAFKRPGFVQDRRVANARQIHDYMVSQVRQAALQDRPLLLQAAEKIAGTESEATRQALDGLQADDRRQILGVQVRLYQALAQHWLGPVGWLVAIWSRLIVFGSGLVALMRFGNPIRQIWGMFSSWRRFRQSRSALEALGETDRVDDALQSYVKVLLVHWADIAELLIQGRFDSRVRRMDDLEKNSAQVRRTLENMWSEALDARIARSARSLSHPLLQILFNLPGVALMGYVGWLTAQRFFSGQYLSSDFFLHAVLTLVIVLLLSFFLLQGIIRLSVGGERIQRRAFQDVEQAMTRHPLKVAREVMEQAARVADLADLA